MGLTPTSALPGDLMQPRERERPGRHTGAAHNSTNTTLSVSASPGPLPVEVIYKVTVKLPNGTARTEFYRTRSAAQRAVERHQEHGREAWLSRHRFVEVPARVRPTVVPGTTDERRAELLLRGVIVSALAHRMYDLELDHRDIGDGDLGLAGAHLLDYEELLDLADRNGWRP